MKVGLRDVSIPKKYRLPLVIALDVVILVAGYFLVLDSQYQNKQRLALEVSAASQELHKLTALKNNIDKARREYAQIRSDLQEAMRQMPEEKEVPSLLRQVSFTAQESKMRIRYFAPKAAQPRDFYSELPFEIRYSAPYHNVGYFFDGVRKMERIVHITSFSLESKGSAEKVILEGSCTAKAYVLSKDAPKEKPLDDKKKEDKNALSPK